MWFQLRQYQTIFQRKLLMPDLTDTDYKKMNIDESFKAQKRDDLKAIYKIKFDNKNTYHERRIITKILKLDKNNQYDYAMSEPMSTSCIKEHSFLSWLEMNLLFKTVVLDEQIRHLFFVNIKFDEKRAINASTCVIKFCHTSLKNKKIQRLTNCWFTNLQN